jgi:hypothetical protein
VRPRARPSRAGPRPNAMRVDSGRSSAMRRTTCSTACRTSGVAPPGCDSLPPHARIGDAHPSARRRTAGRARTARPDCRPHGPRTSSGAPASPRAAVVRYANQGSSSSRIERAVEEQPVQVGDISADRRIKQVAVLRGRETGSESGALTWLLPYMVRSDHIWL